MDTYVRRHGATLVIASATFVLLISCSAAVGVSAVNITAPTNGSSVSGLVTIVSAVSYGVVSVNYYIDGIYLESSPSYMIDWSSNTVANGSHTISVNAFGANNSFLGSSSVTVQVDNVPEIVLLTPHNGSTVSATVQVTINTQSNVSWSSFYIDGGVQSVNHSVYLDLGYHEIFQWQPCGVSQRIFSRGRAVGQRLG